MRINASKTKVMSALIPGEQCQAFLSNGELLEDVQVPRFIATVQGTKEVRNRINLARSAFSRLQSGVVYKRQGLPGNGTTGSVLCLRNVANTSGRQKYACSL